MYFYNYILKLYVVCFYRKKKLRKSLKALYYHDILVTNDTHDCVCKHLTATVLGKFVLDESFWNLNQAFEGFELTCV